MAAANKAVTDYAKAWGLAQDPVDTTGTAAELKAAVEASEDAIDTFLNANGGANALKLGTGQLTYDINETVTTQGTADASENAKLVLLRAAITNQQETNAADLKLKTDAVKTVSTSLQAALDAHAASVTNTSNTDKALTAAKLVTTSALTASDAAETELANYTVTYKNQAGNSVDQNNNGVSSLEFRTAATIEIGATIDNVAATAVYNIATGVWTVPAAFNTVDLTTVKSAIAAEANAYKTLNQAEDLQQLRLDDVFKVSAAQVDGELFTVSRTVNNVKYYVASAADVNTDNTLDAAVVADANIAASALWSTSFSNAIALTPAQSAQFVGGAGVTAGVSVYVAGSATGLTANSASDNYVASLATQKDFNDANTAFEKLVAKVDPARASAVELAALEKAAAAAQKVLTDAGNNIVNLADSVVPVEGTTKADVLLLGTLADDGAATINNFAKAGKDVIYFGADYTFNAGKSATDGVDATLEFFASQVGANVVLTFETTKFGSNVVPKVDAAADQVFTITLTGVDLEDLTIADGFIGFGG